MNRCPKNPEPAAAKARPEVRARQVPAEVTKTNEVGDVPDDKGKLPYVVVDVAHLISNPTTTGGPQRYGPFRLLVYRLSRPDAPLRLAVERRPNSCCLPRDGVKNCLESTGECNENSAAPAHPFAISQYGFQGFGWPEADRQSSWKPLKSQWLARGSCVRTRPMRTAAGVADRHLRWRRCSSPATAPKWPNAQPRAATTLSQVRPCQVPALMSETVRSDTSRLSNECCRKWRSS